MASLLIGCGGNNGEERISRGTHAEVQEIDGKYLLVRPLPRSPEEVAAERTRLWDYCTTLLDQPSETPSEAWNKLWNGPASILTDEEIEGCVELELNKFINRYVEVLEPLFDPAIKVPVECWDEPVDANGDGVTDTVHQLGAPFPQSINRTTTLIVENGDTGWCQDYQAKKTWDLVKPAYANWQAYQVKVMDTKLSGYYEGVESFGKWTVSSFACLPWPSDSLIDNIGTGVSLASSLGDIIPYLSKKLKDACPTLSKLSPMLHTLLVLGSSGLTATMVFKDLGWVPDPTIDTHVRQTYSGPVFGEPTKRNYRFDVVPVENKAPYPCRRTADGTYVPDTRERVAFAEVCDNDIDDDLDGFSDCYDDECMFTDHCLKLAGIVDKAPAEAAPDGEEVAPPAGAPEPAEEAQAVDDCVLCGDTCCTEDK